MSVGEVHVGQPEELSSGPHQCTGRERAEDEQFALPLALGNWTHPTPRWWITIRRHAGPWKTLILLPCWAVSRKTGRNLSR